MSPISPVLTYLQMLRILNGSLKNSKSPGDVRLVGIVFCHPDSKLARDEILPRLLSYEYRSGTYCHFFFPGYRGMYGTHEGDRAIQAENRTQEWIFNEHHYNTFIKEVEIMTTWKYSGGTDLLLTNAYLDDTRDKTVLDYKSTVLVNLERIKNDNIVFEIGMLFEKIFHFASQYKGRNPAYGFSNHMGLSGASSILQTLILSLFPKSVKTDIKNTATFVNRSIERNNV